jgi:type IV pilus assembly protein PilO
MKNLRKFFTMLNLHFAGLILLFGVNIFLIAKLGLAWHAIRSDQSSEFVQEQIQYGQLQAQAGRLQGLPQKVDQSSKDAVKFYAKRIAPNYSTVAEEIGMLTKKDQVRLSRAQYTPAAAVEGLTEVRIDANLSGEYTQLIHFINDLERDKNQVFFTVDGLTLSGQQGGLVNLRLRFTTYLHAGATDLPPNTDDSNAVNLEPASQTEVR